MKITLSSPSEKSHKIFWLVIFAVVLAIVIKQMPASIMSSLLAKQSACRVTMHQTIGSIWDGSAALGFSEPNLVGGGCREPVAITERFSWKSQCSLMQGQCQVDIQFVGLDKPLKIYAYPNQIKVGSGEIALPASILEAFGNPWSTLRPRGQLSANWSELKKGADTSGSIRINIANLSSPISAVKPLGSYEIKANLAQTGTSFELATVAGPLLLKGKGAADSDTKPGLHFAGGAWAAPETEESLIGLLSLLGRKDGDTYRMQY
jgi:general secretion pathway protein N